METVKVQTLAKENDSGSRKWICFTKVSRMVRVGGRLAQDFSFGPALRPNGLGQLLNKRGGEKWVLHHDTKP